MHFLRREGRDKSRSRLFWPQNTAYRDFFSDFRIIQSAWPDGNSKHLGEVSIKAWIPKCSMGMPRSAF